MTTETNEQRERAELKPCPFCGATDAEVVEGSTFRWRVAQCGTCGAQTGEVRVQTLGDGVPEEWERAAIRDAHIAWNTRATLSADAQRQERKPLTDEQIARVYETPELAGSFFESGTEKAIAVARAIEAAHGIGKEQA